MTSRLRSLQRDLALLGVTAAVSGASPLVKTIGGPPAKDTAWLTETHGARAAFRARFARNLCQCLFERAYSLFKFIRPEWNLFELLPERNFFEPLSHVVDHAHALLLTATPVAPAVSA